MSAAVTTDERIDHIIGLIKRLEWRRGMPAKLADAWGCSIREVQRNAAAARHAVALQIRDPDRIVSTIGTVLIDIIRKAHEEGDRDSVVKASRVLIDICPRARAPLQAEIVQTVETVATPQLAAELMRRAFGRVAKPAEVEE